MAEISSEDTPLEATPPDSTPETTLESSPLTTPAPEIASGATPKETRRPPLLALLLLIAAVVLAFYIGTNVLSVIFAVIAPPLPPLPTGMDQVTHTNEAYGVDYWKYTSTGSACEYVKYVQDNGGVCAIAPFQCGAYGDSQGDFTNGNVTVARCSGQMAFSIFHEQWYSLIQRTPDHKAQFELNREVYWIGTGPE